MEKECDGQVSDALISPGIKMEKLSLASKSPRRAEILRVIGWPFEVVAADVDESIREFEAPHVYVERLAREKAAHVAKNYSQEGRLVLGADTIVVVGDEILGKPHDEADARRMLRLLSESKWHEVLTGIALLRSGSVEELRGRVSHEKTRVRFASMSEAEIDWYVKSKEPVDKAGAYAVQGRAALFIEEIQGDYWNIVGLPVRLLYKLHSQV